MAAQYSPHNHPYALVIGYARGMKRVIVRNRPVPRAQTACRPAKVAPVAEGALVTAAPSEKDRPAAEVPTGREPATPAKDKVTLVAPTAKATAPAVAEKTDPKRAKPAEPQVAASAQPAVAKPAKEHQSEPELDSLLDDAAGAPKRENRLPVAAAAPNRATFFHVSSRSRSAATDPPILQSVRLIPW